MLLNLKIEGPAGDDLESHLSNLRDMGLDAGLSIGACFEWLESAYESLPDPYGDVLTWHITWDGGVYQETLPGGLWNAYCESPEAFRGYLRLFVFGQ